MPESTKNLPKSSGRARKLRNSLRKTAISNQQTYRNPDRFSTTNYQRYSFTWVFAQEQYWVPFDEENQKLIENCWDRGVQYTNLLSDTHFGGSNQPVLIDFENMQADGKFSMCRCYVDRH